eukprot:c21589_g1_i2 orf=314-904(-)
MEDATTILLVAMQSRRKEQVRVDVKEYGGALVMFSRDLKEGRRLSSSMKMKRENMQAAIRIQVSVRCCKVISVVDNVAVGKRKEAREFRPITNVVEVRGSAVGSRWPPEASRRVWRSKRCCIYTNWKDLKECLSMWLEESTGATPGFRKRLHWWQTCLCSILPQRVALMAQRKGVLQIIGKHSLYLHGKVDVYLPY